MRRELVRAARQHLLVGALTLALVGGISVSNPGVAQATTTHPAPDCGCGDVTTYTFSPQGAALFGSDTYLVFTPDSYTGRTAVPLVVVTHGCDTTAAEQEGASDYDQLAEKYGFIVMYPDDNDRVHVGGCWNWEAPFDWQRGRSDLAVIVGMTKAVMFTYRIDPKRVYEIGMSAGALLSSDLAAAYPDVYAAVGIMAGGPYGAGEVCVASGNDPPSAIYDPEITLSANGAYQEEAARKRVIPVIVLNGDADNVVNPLCDQLAVAQWLETDNLVIEGSTAGPLSLTPSSTVHGQVPNGYSYQVLNYTEPSGCLIAQHWIIHGMGHDWSGGTSNPAYRSYTDPKGPSASEASWDFLSHYTLGSTSGRCAEVPSS
ncbi:MAG TPA: PHB depolymerase family esterase [Acidimicrobiales bacterium]|jgi:poly(hydroxyalkanoate) depolymerase family esterase